MLKTLANELMHEGILPRNTNIVVGVSGGADSMALLHLIRDLNKLLNLELKLHVAHFNHQLRGKNSDEDAAFVQAACDNLALPCTVISKPIAELAQKVKKSVEETARQERYSFYELLCMKADASHVALGHHANDNAETVLHRIIRGTGLRGLSGIPQKRKISSSSDVDIIRPLLRRDKKWIKNYLSDAGIAWREDSSNESNDITRNRLRNQIIPLLEETVNPQVQDALIRLCEQACWLEEFLRETVQKTFEILIISRNDQQLILNAESLVKKSRIVQTEIIRLAYISFGLGEQDLSFTHLSSALDMLSNPASGKQVQFPSGMTIEKSYHQLIFSRPTDEPREDISPEIAVHLPGTTVLPIRRLKIECDILNSPVEKIHSIRKSKTAMEEYIDYEQVRPPLVVRTRRHGDRFFPLGAPGTKKISEFLIDSKVQTREREKVAVLCDNLGPIWIIGHRIDERVKLTSMTRQILHLKAGPLT